MLTTSSQRLLEMIVAMGVEIEMDIEAVSDDVLDRQGTEVQGRLAES